VSVERKFKMALDETRLLMLGSQILFGFEFNVVFNEAFEKLPVLSRQLDGIALLLIALAMALLIAPGTQHRLTYDGHITPNLHHTATVFAGWALLPFAISLGLDIYIAFERGFSLWLGVAAGVFFTALALVLWYGLEIGYRRAKLKGRHVHETIQEKPTSLQVKIDQMLTEARIVIPGAQALLGFQFLVSLSQVFARLPPASKIVHGVALACVAFALLLLIAPAAFHRLAFKGEDAQPVFRFGSACITAALLPLALGISGDIYVAITRIADSPAAGTTAAALALLLFLTFWYAQPLLLHRSLQTGHSAK